MTLHTWPSASKSRLPLVGGILIFKLMRFRPLLLWDLFLRESQLQRVPTDHRNASSMPSSGLLGLVTGLQVTQRQLCLPGDFLWITILQFVLELGSSEAPHTEETPGWCSRALAPGVPPESAVYFLYSLGQEGAHDRSIRQGEVNRPGLMRVSSG